MTKPRLRPKTENEKTIYNLIIRHRLPFRFISGKMSLRGLAVDFVGKKKKKILEIHNEERTAEQLQDRMLMWTIHGYDVFYIWKSYFTEPKLMRILPIQLKSFYNA